MRLRHPNDHPNDHSQHDR